MTANVGTKIRHLRAIARAKSSASKISTNTETGVPRPSTEASGIRAWTRVGLRTTTDIGPGLIPGDGLGLTMRAGATHLSITGVGFSSAAAGVGYPARAKFVPSTLRHWSLSSVELESESAATSRGFHSVRGKYTCRHTV